MEKSEETQSDTFDRGIVPAETAARKKREGADYKQTPKDTEGDTDTTAGYTTSNEGLTNNYAIEPEMYIDEPGDLSDEQ
ncbi:hypothetical protein [Leptolyngbya sp. BC1307]|jgi:hypothetical protein|uniref:hypothetical protein n=1 Tax=Leptolyngbya sp. BC1307 TaxID=2029589 RepID=UPI001980623B|nr:hypothetical protein [Leptolyngbya sp. BC1307]